MIEIRKYQIRSAGGKAQTATKEITIPANWIKKHNIKIGDEVTVVVNNVLIVIPPRASREEEDRVLAFAQDREGRTNDPR